MTLESYSVEGRTANLYFVYGETAGDPGLKDYGAKTVQFGLLDPRSTPEQPTYMLSGKKPVHELAHKVAFHVPNYDLQSFSSNFLKLASEIQPTYVASKDGERHYVRTATFLTVTFFDENDQPKHENCNNVFHAFLSDIAPKGPVRLFSEAEDELPDRVSKVVSLRFVLNGDSDFSGLKDVKPGEASALGYLGRIVDSTLDISHYHYKDPRAPNTFPLRAAFTTYAQRGRLRPSIDWRPLDEGIVQYKSLESPKQLVKGSSSKSANDLPLALQVITTDATHRYVTLQLVESSGSFDGLTRELVGGFRPDIIHKLGKFEWLTATDDRGNPLMLALQARSSKAGHYGEAVGEPLTVSLKELATKTLAGEDGTFRSLSDLKLSVYVGSTGVTAAYLGTADYTVVPFDSEDESYQEL